MKWNIVGSAAAILLFAAAPASAAEIRVTMSGAAYHPDRINAKIGDTIRFVNDDGVNHDVFVPTAGHALDLGKQEPGQEAVMPLGKAGIFEVECVFHPGMLTIVEVK